MCRRRGGIKRMRWQSLVYKIVGLVLLAGTLAWLFSWRLGTALVFAAFFVVTDMVCTRNSHRAQMRSLLRGVQPSNKEWGQEYSLASQARTQSAAVIWSMEVASLALVGCGLGILVTDPGQWLMALVAIGFFGLCAAVNTYMLVLRWRGAHTGSRP